MNKLNLLLIALLGLSINLAACDSEDDTTPKAGEMAGEEHDHAGEEHDHAGEHAGEEHAGEHAGEEHAGEHAGEEHAGEHAGEEHAGETPAGETPAGETPAGETPAGETPAGETPAGETPAGETPEITCEMQCGDFANCAVSDCAGYDESAREVLYDGCMEICEPSPAIASVYAMYPTCEEKLMFAANARAGFAELCAGGADAFCWRYTETCGEWDGDTSCVDWYNAAAPGTPDDMGGATQGCYEYHLGAAEANEAADAAIHCPHARGIEVCVD